ncbi:hypothetical protein [Pedobacter heparinus]|uniref:Ig-like domain-containing protein n=1 Tax=Pedobacter heparinus (strain ATCC 13125 / DSM 2366 / CIP 104194 / JCM 7457 / NBRC 12017 / NCIMB 9290 / NRRL B-14731 / HIM 762-3) TaxID=485917 RepID=C6XUK9_PEDHD|nr:hypothetical protein [Pedobacter heparinus]ACU03859.1 hypothetical protein Phep_1647 [Pedobacter heparinus DSM 2366]
MKKSFTKIAIVTIVVLFGNLSTSFAQAVTPTTSNVQFVCEGGILTLGSPGSANQWIVKYDANSPTPGSPTTVTPNASNQITGTDVKTGYYIITNKSTDAGTCESEAQIIPVYVLPTLTPTITAANSYCTEQAGTTTFTGSATPAAPSGAELVYQWYTYDGTTETIIAGQTDPASFHPTVTNSGSTPINAIYRLKVAYKVGTLLYCPQTASKTVSVLPRPTTPAITIGNPGTSTF